MNEKPLPRLVSEVRPSPARHLRDDLFTGHINSLPQQE